MHRTLVVFAISVGLGCGGGGSLPADEDPALDASSVDDSSVDGGGGTEPTSDEVGAVASDATGDGRIGDALGTEVATSGDAGVKCGTSTCGAGESCCASADSPPKYECVTGKCPSGSGFIACDGPEDCTGGACCSDVVLTSSCSPSVRAAECRTSCLTIGPAPCPGTAKLRRCHASKDCTQPVYSKCCSFESSGVVSDVCANDAMVPYAKSCH